MPLEHRCLHATRGCLRMIFHDFMVFQAVIGSYVSLHRVVARDSAGIE